MTEQEKYEAAVKALEAAQYLVNLPRCVNCDHMMKVQGRCDKYGDVPQEYAYTPTDCGDFVDEVPF